MTLRKILLEYIPISCEAEVLKVMSIISERHTKIDSMLELYLTNNTLPEFQSAIKAKIENYKSEYNERLNDLPYSTTKKKNVIKRKSSASVFNKGGISEDDTLRKNMFSFRSESKDSLSSKGYEYGLSDW